MRVAEHARRLAFFAACLLVGSLSFYRLPPTDNPWTAFPFVVAFFVGIPLFVYGDWLAIVETRVLRWMTPFHPEHAPSEVLAVKCFGVMLMVAGGSAVWILQ